LYGGALDNETGGLIGWGWNGNENPSAPSEFSNEGAGWVQLNALGGESGVVYPWLQTVYGSVFSRNIRQKSMITGINATYCIFADSVYNFNSSDCPGNIANININFPQQSANDQVYKNALGRLDVKGLTAVTKNANGIKYNKYNNVILSFSDDGSGIIWGIGNKLESNNTVYIIDGDLTVTSGFSIKQGNGIVVVNGSLTIGSDFDYDSQSVEDIKQLASVAWVVKGDVIINSNVQKIVGAFVILGGNESCLHEDGSSCSEAVIYPKYKQNSYGIFFSGASSQPLTVYGLLVAKAFDFRRTYSDIAQGSERIIYDGRLVANPPPGFKGFIESLPVVRDFEF
jgi:hypothetical protein